MNKTWLNSIMFPMFSFLDMKLNENDTISGAILHIESSTFVHLQKMFSALLATCAGKSPVPGEFTAQKPVTRSFNVFFDLRLNKRLSKQWRGWWFETLSRLLWRHRNGGLAIICRQHFQVHFLERKSKYFDYILTYVCCLVPIYNITT